MFLPIYKCLLKKKSFLQKSFLLSYIFSFSVQCERIWAHYYVVHEVSVFLKSSIKESENKTTSYQLYFVFTCEL